MKHKLDVVLAGVGGQGTLVAGKLLGAVAGALDLDVKISEVHGMAQRGGSVITYARLGERVYSPVVEEGQADFLLAFEELEALRWARLLGKDGVALISTQHLVPVTVAMGGAAYPDRIPELLAEACSAARRVISLDAPSLAREAGNIRTMNVVMLGAMAAQAQLPVSAWHQALVTVFPDRLRDVNRRAFDLGYGTCTP